MKGSLLVAKKDRILVLSVQDILFKIKDCRCLVGADLCYSVSQYVHTTRSSLASRIIRSFQSLGNNLVFYTSVKEDLLLRSNLEHFRKCNLKIFGLEIESAILGVKSSSLPRDVYIQAQFPELNVTAECSFISSFMYHCLQMECLAEISDGNIVRFNIHI